MPFKKLICTSSTHTNRIVKLREAVCGTKWLKNR